MSFVGKLWHWEAELPDDVVELKKLVTKYQKEAREVRNELESAKETSEAHKEELLLIKKQMKRKSGSKTDEDELTIRYDDYLKLKDKFVSLRQYTTRIKQEKETIANEFNAQMELYQEKNTTLKRHVKKLKSIMAKVKEENYTLRAEIPSSSQETGHHGGNEPQYDIAVTEELAKENMKLQRQHQIDDEALTQIQEELKEFRIVENERDELNLANKQLMDENAVLQESLHTMCRKVESLTVTLDETQALNTSANDEVIEPKEQKKLTKKIIAQFELPEDEVVFNWYTCGTAYVYLTTTYMCYQSVILGENRAIRYDSISSVNKKRSRFLLNSIEIRLISGEVIVLRGFLVSQKKFVKKLTECTSRSGTRIAVYTNGKEL